MQTLPDSSKSLKLNQEEIKHPNNRTKKSPDIYIKKNRKIMSNIITSDALTLVKKYSHEQPRQPPPEVKKLVVI